MKLMKMKKYKKAMKKMLGLGLDLGISSVAVSSLPANDISPEITEGYSKMAGVFPAYGSLAGAGMTLGLTKKLTNTKFKKTKKKFLK